MHVLVAPQEFKGTLTASEAARAMAEGVRQARPTAQVSMLPWADGGPGTLELCATRKGAWRRASVRGPLGRSVEARRLAMEAEHAAVVEMAEASGLLRLAPPERDVRTASTFGTGELLRHAPCQPPSCLSPGSTCTPGADAGTPGACCTGTSCINTNEGGFACGTPTDAGVQCSPDGVSCTTGTSCCSGSCIGNVCQAVAACQPQNGACTATPDCCTGLTCSIPAGSASGTCQPGTAACPGLGQSCTVGGTACCSGLSCVDQYFVACSGATPCTCTAVIN